MKKIKEYLVEKFVADSDPIKDMNIGKRNQILKDLSEIGIKQSDVEIANDYFIKFKGGDYLRNKKLTDIQLKYMPEEKRAFAISISRLANNVSPAYPQQKLSLEECIQQALDDKISVSDIKELINEFAKELKNEAFILIAKLSRTKKEKKFDDENNIYVFIGFTNKVAVTIGGKKYYEDKLSTEGIIKIDKFDTSQLQQISMMKLRVQFQNYEDGAVYMVSIPKDMMDDDRYTEIPKHMYEIFEKYKKRI